MDQIIGNGSAGMHEYRGDDDRPILIRFNTYRVEANNEFDKHKEAKQRQEFFSQLEASRRVQDFKRDADEVESWVAKELREIEIEPDDYTNPIILSTVNQKHCDLNEELMIHSKTLSRLSRIFEETVFQRNVTFAMMCQRLLALWRNLIALSSHLNDKKVKIKQAMSPAEFIRLCDCIMAWIHDQEAFIIKDNFEHDPEHAEMLHRQFKKDVGIQECRINEINRLAQDVLPCYYIVPDDILEKIEELNESWQRLMSFYVQKNNLELREFRYLIEM